MEISNLNRGKKRISLFGIRVTAILSISLVLFLVGILTIVALSSRKLSVLAKESITVSVLLKSDVTAQDINLLQNRLQRKDFVKNLNFVSKEEAVKQLAEELGTNVEDFLGYNPMQSFFELGLKSEYANRDSIVWIKKEVLNSGKVQDVIYREELLNVVNKNLDKISIVITFLSLVLFFISMVLVNNTIKLHIYSKRFLIRTMQLVGATNGFIRSPFVQNNVVNGLWASGIASVLLLSLLKYSFSEVADILPQLLSNRDIVRVVMVVFVSGISITWISAYFAVGRYLRMKTEKLYYE
ncbi:MAG TPA: cell division protein FtsX [Porphyromonadaceae bacterium]|nr:cell division protein FtsX [Porphyromonadaceae bacterium]